MKQVFYSLFVFTTLISCTPFSLNNAYDRANIDYSAPHITFASKGTDLFIEIKWIAQQHDIQAYIIYKGATKDTLQEIARVSGSLSNYKDDSYDFQVAKKYYYAVQAVLIENEKSQRSNIEEGYIAKITVSLPGPLLSYSFNEASGQMAVDSSGNGNHGTFYGAQWTSGIKTNALEFDGTDDYLGAALAAPIEQGDFTISGWFRPSAVSTGGQRLITIAGTGAGFWVNNNQYAWWNTDASLTGTGVSCTAGEWVYLAATRMNNVLTIYVNGTPVASCNDTEELNSTLLVGGNGSGTEGFEGTIDEIKIYNQALSAEAIKASYYKTTLVLSYSFDEGNEITAVDTSGNGNLAAIIGAQPTSSGIKNSALEFDGVNDYLEAAIAAPLEQGDFTISGWFRPATQSTGWKKLITLGSNGAGFWVNNNQYVWWSASAYNTGTNFSCTAADWVYLAATRKNNLLTIYVNGNPVASTNDTERLDSTLLIGGNSSGPNCFEGTIDEIKIYNQALTAQMIDDQYQTIVSP